MSRTVRFTFTTISYNLDTDRSSVDGHPIMTVPFIATFDGETTHGSARIKTRMPEDTKVEALQLVNAPVKHLDELEAAAREYFSTSIPRYMHTAGVGVVTVGTFSRSSTYMRQATAVFVHNEAGLEFQRWEQHAGCANGPAGCVPRGRSLS